MPLSVTWQPRSESTHRWGSLLIARSVVSSAPVCESSSCERRSNEPSAASPSPVSCWHQPSWRWRSAGSLFSATRQASVRRGSLRRQRCRSSMRSPFSPAHPISTINATDAAPRPSHPATESHCRPLNGHRWCSPSSVTRGNDSIFSCLRERSRETWASAASLSATQPEMLSAVSAVSAETWRRARSVTREAEEMSRRTASVCLESIESHGSPPSSESGAKLGNSRLRSTQSWSRESVSRLSQARESK
mmetsp:Transcript_42467/g.105737  ORF Transcript_42467/g.105737 Transcript_42467/m.105737 type:complete len:248 (-) Transcript_42467:549-1292(-)